jgi:hypothetical protein
VSRVPLDPRRLDRDPPLPDPGPPGSVFVATALLTFVSGVSWLLVPLLFVPGVTVRWLRAIRGVEGPAPQLKRAGLVYLVMAYAPVACGLASVVTRGQLAPPAVLGPLGVALALVPLLLRAPLVLVSDRPEDRRLGLLDGLRRSLATAAARPLETVILSALHVGATLVALGLGRAVGSMLGFDAAVGLLLAIALPPVLWTPVMMLASRWTPETPPRPTVRSLGVLALMLVPALGAIAAIAVLATKDPLPLEVLVEGRGIQHERGMMLSEGARGLLDQPGFTLRPGRWSDPWVGRTLVVDPGDAPPYPIAAEYDPAVALMVPTPCGEDCVSVALRGPDWAMQVRLDEHGGRLDDALLDRAIARVGVTGTAAFAVGALAVALTWLLLSRAARTARRLAGAGYRHRLAGRLRLGEHGALEDGALIGPSNRVELLEGSVTLRAPERIAPLGVDLEAARALDGADVVVSMNEALTIGTHRSADTPWPEGAALVLGSPAAIESAELARASRTITVIVLAAGGVCALSLAALSFS